MLGLPFERIADLDGIAGLIIKIKKVAKGLNITVNVNNFVPKPHTPFQWHPMEKEPELNFKINYLKKLLKPLNVNFRYQDPKVSFIEGLISRGDDFTPRTIYNAYKFGAVYDSESRLFNYDAWVKALEYEYGCEYDYNWWKNNRGNGTSNFNKLTYRYLYEEKNIDAPLPWDFIDILVDKDFLKEEYKKSRMQNFKSIYPRNASSADSSAENLLTENCRKICYLCGVCDFKTLSPVYSSKAENIRIHKKNGKDDKNCIDGNNDININTEVPGRRVSFSELTFIYSKRGAAKYLGHLETVKILLKAFRITGIPLIYRESKFTSRPKLSFSNPIPFMSESDGLHIKARVSAEYAVETDLNILSEKINSILPDGLKIVSINI